MGFRRVPRTHELVYDIWRHSSFLLDNVLCEWFAVFFPRFIRRSKIFDIFKTMTIGSRANFLAVFFFHLICVCYPCACPYKHPQTAVCDADWALLGTVQASLNITGDDGQAKHKYEIFIIKVIKDKSSKLKDKSVTAVITPLDDCAVNIQKDSRTIFTGSFDGLGSATMTNCDWHEDYTEVPKCQRRNLFKKFYEKNCGCIVCFAGGCPTDSTPHCVLRSFDDCDIKNSHCAMYSGCNKCSWRRCVSYYDCQDSQVRDFE